MSDGIKLAARLWLPEDAEQNPVPALLEYLPYRKRDGTRLRDETTHPYFSQHGYACIRVDIRGSGDSEGLPMDEYVKQEQDDGLDVIAWLERQPWCTGNVGMFGASWGGFNSLQVAARRPPALKAIMTHVASDDRYSDDAHYKGGTLINTQLWGGALFLIAKGQPPDPEIVGERWRDMWLERIDGIEFYLLDWLRHQHRDEFWKHGSVNEDYSDIKCAVYAIGGWLDPYRSVVPRLLAGLKSPGKGLNGPWGHHYPHEGVPGPLIDYLGEALRWWDYWLKGIDTGILEEPQYRVWMQNESASSGKNEIAGRWVAEESWPSPRINQQTWYLNASGLGDSQGSEKVLKLAPLQTVGQAAPRWFMVDSTTDFPVDQRIDDARSLTFDSDLIEKDFEILGAPVVVVELAVDKPVANLAVRLNEVFPDQSVKRVTYGVLNLTHRDSHENPTPLEPGKRYRIRIQLDDIAHRFTRGNRLRVAMSTTYWPHTWPSPEPVNLTLFTGKSSLEIPVRPKRLADRTLEPFGPAFVPETSGQTVIDPGVLGSKVWIRDIGGDVLTLRAETPESKVRLDAIGTVLSQSVSEKLSIDDKDPTSATFEMRHMNGWERGDSWNARVETIVCVSVTRDDFLVTGKFQAFDHDKLIAERNWNEKIPRILL